MDINDASLLSYFWQASWVVKGVLLILVSASVLSWAIILQRIFYFRDMNKITDQFEEMFCINTPASLSRIMSGTKRSHDDGLASIFLAGFKAYQHLKHDPHVALTHMVDSVGRAMQAAKIREQDKLEESLSFLAIVGSISPYIGLFGTVWGIMQSFRSLASVQQATISMVAPGIAEALIATAIGLFAAIPAVIAYNRFLNTINQLVNRMDAFCQEFTNKLINQYYAESTLHRQQPEITNAEIV